MWQKLVVVSSQREKRGARNVVKADEQERDTRETQERERCKLYSKQDELYP